MFQTICFYDVMELISQLDDSNNGENVTTAELEKEAAKLEENEDLVGVTMDLFDLE